MQIIRNLAEIEALPKCNQNSIVVKLSYYQKSGFKSVFLEFGPGKDPNWSDLSLILSEIWSVFGLILAILGPEYKVEALTMSSCNWQIMITRRAASPGDQEEESGEKD